MVSDYLIVGGTGSGGSSSSGTVGGGGAGYVGCTGGCFIGKCFRI